MNHKDSRVCGAMNCNQKINPQVPFLVLSESRVVGFCSESCRMRYENKDARDERGKVDARVYE